MTYREELYKQILGWDPELPFAAKDGYRLILHIDAFNNHMYWVVEWNNGEYDCCEEFDNFAGARDYFLAKINETNYCNI